MDVTGHMTWTYDHGVFVKGQQEREEAQNENHDSDSGT